MGRRREKDRSALLVAVLYMAVLPFLLQNTARRWYLKAYGHKSPATVEKVRCSHKSCWADFLYQPDPDQPALRGSTKIWGRFHYAGGWAYHLEPGEGRFSGAELDYDGGETVVELIGTGLIGGIVIMILWAGRRKR